MKTMSFVTVTLLIMQMCACSLYKDEFCPLRNDETGICKFLPDCPTAIYDLNVLRKKPGLCGFQNLTPIVCCNATKTDSGSVSPKPSTSTPKIPPSIDNRLSISQTKCQLYSNYVYRNQSSPTLLPGIVYEVINSCNVKPTFEHNDVLSGEYPHLVSIDYSTTNNPIYKCTGALISQNYVLTTASCTIPNTGVPRKIRLGTTIKQAFYFEYPEIQYIEVSEFIRHPNYNEVTKTNDIALIKLAYSPTINALVRPACLPETTNLNETIAVGYSSLGNFGVFLENMKENVLVLQPSRSCVNSRNRKLRNKKCGEFVNGSCVLDSGAPLQTINKSPYCTYTINGLISSWEGCDPNKPIQITDVSKYTEWIAKTIWV